MISLSEARRIIEESVVPRRAGRVPLAEAAGRVLAEPVEAKEFFPAADVAMMDGYAVRADDAPGVFQIAGESPAGAAPDRTLNPGEAMRIFTGGILPAGASRVVPQENVVREGEKVSIPEFPDPLFVRPKGSEAKPGQQILAAGMRIGAAESAILAQAGVIEPLVISAPLVHHLATGSELVAAGEKPMAGQVRDSNSALLAAFLAGLRIPFASRRVPDSLEELMRHAEGPADLLLISGGASVGEYDFGAEVLRGLGYTIHFSQVNLRPGRPLTFATRGAQVAFVLPGNPVSHFVCWHVAVRLTLEKMLGLPARWNFLDLEICGGEPIRPNPRETFWPARIGFQDGRLGVTPLRWSTSGDTFSLAGADALVRVNKSSPANGRAETLLLDV